MKATGVIARFLSLLDITLILLGVLMITLMQTQLRTDAKQERSSTDKMTALADLDFVYLYAGWEGAENGRCYLLDAQGGIGREIRTDTANDIQEILSARRGQTERSNQVLMLLFSDDGWDAAWTAEKLAEIEQKWEIRLVRVYNAKISRRVFP